MTGSGFFRSNNATRRLLSEPIQRRFEATQNVEPFKTVLSGLRAPRTRAGNRLTTSSSIRRRSKRCDCNLFSPPDNMKHKLLIIAGALGVTGAAVAGALYLAYPVQVSTLGGLTRNYFVSWSAPPGATTTEVNAAYKGAVAAAPQPTADRRGVSAEHNRPRLAELQQNSGFRALLAVESDQCEEC
jgi:hypothetical protein